MSYGGDTRVVATRSEIERIAGSLGLVQKRLYEELSPIAQIHGIVNHIQLDLQLPETFVRLGLQRTGCYVASESYFSGDAQVAHAFSALSQTFNNKAWMAGGAVGLVSAFGNSNLSALAVRSAVGKLPLATIGAAIDVLPAERIRIVEQPATISLAPNSLSSVASRLNNSSGNIRIEGYQTNKGRVLFVYLPGTADWSPVGGTKAFDLRSDIALATNAENAKSIRAANAALLAYGAKSNDRLVLVGYSQGGMVAAQLAEQKQNVVGVVTIGSPIANDSIPKSIPVVSLEHSNDIVPALAGKTNPITENWVTASRHFELKPGETVIRAHEMASYLETAKLADESSDVGLIRLREAVLGNIAGAKQLEVREFQPLRATS